MGIICIYFRQYENQSWRTIPCARKLTLATKGNDSRRNGNHTWARKCSVSWLASQSHVEAYRAPKWAIKANLSGNFKFRLIIQRCGNFALKPFLWKLASCHTMNFSDNTENRQPSSSRVLCAVLLILARVCLLFAGFVWRLTIRPSSWSSSRIVLINLNTVTKPC